MKPTLAAGLAMALLAACGSSSSDGASGPALTPIAGPLDPSAAARAALLLASCLAPGGGGQGVDALLADLYGRRSGDAAQDVERNAVPCLAGKTNGCQGVTECTGVTVDTVDACTPGCAGTVATACDGSQRTRTDCARAGARCVFAEGLATCTTQASPACTEASFVPSCDNGRPVYCSGGTRHEGPLCADFDADCGTPPEDNEYACYGRGAECASTVAVGQIQYVGISCDSSTTLEACLNAGTTSVDCTKLGVGFKCETDGVQAFFCGMAGECVPTSARSSCDGSKVVLCNAGHVESIDCSPLGFKSCSMGRCVP
jgi:hypothetical protein